MFKSLVRRAAITAAFCVLLLLVAGGDRTHSGRLEAVAPRSPAGTLEVLDASQRHVGYWLDEKHILRTINGLDVAILAVSTGYLSDRAHGAKFIHFKTPNCSGQPYLSRQGTPGSMLREGTVASGHLHFAGEPLERFAPRSIRSISSDSARCIPFKGPPEEYAFGPLVRVGVDFTPPFLVR